MTEKALAGDRREGVPAGRWAGHGDSSRWRIMAAGDEIVFVGVTSAHRSSAFDAGQFIMDGLKTRAPF